MDFPERELIYYFLNAWVKLTSLFSLTDRQIAMAYVSATSGAVIVSVGMNMMVKVCAKQISLTVGISIH